MNFDEPSFIFKLVKFVFVVVFVLIIAQFGAAIWLGAKAVEAVENGKGLKEVFDTVWCGSGNGTGLDCVDDEAKRVVEE